MINYTKRPGSMLGLRSGSAVGSEPYQVMMTVPNVRNTRAVLRCAEDAETPYLWQVLFRHTTVNFHTLREATDFCRQQGWL